jgi:ADP-ribosylglycohydrolase
VYNETLKEAQRQSKLTGCSTVLFWIENTIGLDDVSEMPDPNYRPISFIKIAFCWAFYYLKNNFSFEDAIRDIISRGGDTSINAAIVGGLIGALHGKSTIP